MSRKTSKRIWLVSICTLWVLPLTLAGGAVADTNDKVLPASYGEGWFWKDAPIAPNVDQNPIGQPYTYPFPAVGTDASHVNWQGDHLYVGWDKANSTEEMFAGINFNLSFIPSGSEVIKFQLTLMEHPSGSGHNNTPNHDDVVSQGVVACSWPSFIAGAQAAPFSDAPSGRDCASKVVGQTTATATDQFTPDVLVPWTFDLTSIAAEWANGSNAGIYIGPNPDLKDKANLSWITSFHSSTYQEQDPVTQQFTAKPGVFATVEWNPPGDNATVADVTGFGESTGAGDSFTDAGTLTEQLLPDPTTSTEPQPQLQLLAAGTYEGKPAGFWSHLLLPGIAAVAGMFLISFAGWAVQTEGTAARPPGAASHLMNGSGAKREKENEV
ncbi:MAG: hypothetical protein ABR507_07020 [Actinomycetota bacterium]